MNVQNSHHCCIHRVSWSAVFVGSLVGIGLAFLLNLFGLAIGLSAFTTSTTGNISLAIGGIIGLGVGVFVSMYLCGFTAGYLGRRQGMNRNIGIIYGFTAWCVALVLSVLLASQFSHYVTNYSDMVANTSTVVITNKDNTRTMQAPTPVKARGKTAVVNTDNTNILGMSMFVMFLLFFIGAASSCFGGYYGMSCNENC